MPEHASRPAPPSAPDAAPADTNLVVLCGEITRPPTVRELPSESVVVQFDLETVDASDGRASRRSVPAAWHDPSTADRRLIEPGRRVVVVGSVQRRFFRVGGQTQSRTEVIVSRLVPIRRRKTLARVLAEVNDAVSRAGEPRARSGASG